MGGGRDLSAMLSIQEAAARLRIDVRTLRVWCLTGQVEHFTSGTGRIRIPARALRTGGALVAMREKVERLLRIISELKGDTDRLNAQADRLGAMVSGLRKLGGRDAGTT